MDTFWKQPKKQRLMLLGSVVLGLAFVLVSASVIHERGEVNEESEQEQVATQKEEVREFNTRLLSSLFRNLQLEAEAAFVWDVNADQSIYAKNEDQQLPLASLTKIMTALVAREHLASAGSVTIDYDAYFTEGNSGLVPLERWNVNDLIDFTLVVSSNDGAEALAGAYASINNKPKDAFVEVMNQEARALGLKSLSFNNPTGLDDEAAWTAEALGSAKDTTLLIDHILNTHPDLLEATTKDQIDLYSESNIYHTAQNTNKLVDEIPFLIGSKTGYTTLAGGNLAVVFDAGLMQPVVITVLGSSKEGRFNDMSRLQEAVSEYFEKKREL